MHKEEEAEMNATIGASLRPLRTQRWLNRPGFDGDQIP
jgi:hypothetical protein